MNFEIRKDMPASAFRKHWQFCVGSGEACLALRTDYVKQLKQVHDELGIQYVRFHGIFDDEMGVVTSLSQVLGAEGCREILEYNFHNIGLAYDNVLSCGMKPFVELSFMPSLLAANDDLTLFFTKFHISPPKSYAVWTDFIKQFIQFLLHRYGEAEVESWYFEVWNEPDLFNFFSGKKADYYELYKATVLAIKAVNEKIRVGGPATSGSKWIRSFLAYSKENELPVDFVSTHQYAGDPLGGFDMTEELEEDNVYFDLSKIWRFDAIDALPEDVTLLEAYRTQMPDRTEMEMQAKDNFVRHAAYVREEAKGLPLIYTEWNCNSTFSAYTNDTRKVAAYDVKTAFDVEPLLDGSSIWCFSDIFDEFHLFPEEFHGGFGLLSGNGIPKPVYYALKEMSALGEQRIDIGDQVDADETAPVEMAAFKGADAMQIVLYRLCMQQLDLPKTSTCVTVACEREPASVTWLCIDEEHGNPLKCWEAMGRPRDLNRKEIESIKAASAVTREALAYTYEDGKVTFSMELGVNDVAFVNITY